ncbi:MAG: outer membrane lipoprotein-sorting protein [Runella slithyformis]|nr:MAG: outer membrane lipoprotein-sorting protein [Runella slithyformis]TAE96321.1 MAG: outer membrane lipoprotein-sorting protein [Runella slithyformis]TAF25648.1 MAG: outer membrane lipoprotein-sorting protein [Runella slithyformis]TAF43993.1 MAG: outer membrane lipoprotein-sorting protein [Runella slithyformis]TAF79931.1 MAG: outer membrane lipoprotein-sorting protein [Runella slithyformis]
MKKLILSLAFATLSFATVNAQTADEIITKMVEARGGADKLSAIKSMKMEATMAVMGMELPVKTVLVPKRGMRIDISAMGQEIVQAVDGTTAWTIAPPMGVTTPTELPAEQAKPMLGQLDISGGLIGYKENGTTVELLGKEKLDAADVFKLKMTTKDGIVATNFVDATTYYILKTVVSIGGAEVETRISNYKMIDGVAFPFTTEIKNEQMGTMTTNVTKIELNQTIDESIFKMPKQ